MRNLWFIMKTFNVLPTNKDFRELTDDQINLILYSLEEDYKEAERASKGLSVESDYYDDSFEEEVWNREVGEWKVLKEGHDPDDIARQVEELTREEDLKNLYSKFDSLDEYNEYLASGGKTARESEVESYIDKQIRVAQEKARAIEENRKKKRNKEVLMDDKDLPNVNDKSNSTQGLEDLHKEAIEKSIELFNKKEEDDDYTLL